MPTSTATGTGTAPGAWSIVLASLPRGGLLPGAVWERRHRLVLWLLGLHALGILAYALLRPAARTEAVGGALAIVAVAVLASIPLRRRLVRSMLGSLGLMTCSVVLIQLSGGLTEFHFHIFVALAIVTLYQEWLPFLASILFVMLHHGIVGGIDPSLVYDNAAALAQPWRWALVHAVFITAASAAFMLQWRAQEDLRDETSLMLDASGEGLLRLDEQGTVAYANPAAGELMGRRRESLVGQPVAQLLDTFMLPERRHGPSHAQEATIRLPGGGERSVECLLTPIERRGQRLGHVLTFRDLTERRRAEEERLQAREQQIEQLRSVDELKTQFLNAAAHELRTPLMPLGLQVEILRRRLERDGQRPEDIRALELLQRNFERLERLVEDILSVARLEAGRMTVHKQPLELRGAIAEVHETFQALAQANRIELQVSCEDGLWVEVDTLRFHQILFNLLGNAIRYSDGPGTVAVIATGSEAEAVVHVRDTGRGFTQEQTGRLFQPFGQLNEGAGAERAGTGLGLYITKALVELHNGRIWVQSPGPGHGATFSFAIPRCRAPGIRAIFEKQPTQVPAPAAPMRLAMPPAATPARQP